ncbi:MAG: hypothetical protein ACFFAO_18485, partial [Candidatus Hermodarchaeota archaeon]
VFYKIKRDPTVPPFHWKGTDSWGNPSESWVFMVELLGISPKEFYGEKFTKGDFKGEPLYTDGRKYKLWLPEKQRATFLKFWREILDKPMNSFDDFDDTIFIFSKGKKLSKNNKKYTVFKFKKATK